MKRTRRELDQEEEGVPLLLLPNNTCKVVEYLEPVMSKELMCKFPDNSAFDFDYSQSSIWSPLVPRRVHCPLDLEELQLLASATPRRRKLDYGFGAGDHNDDDDDDGDGGGKKKKRVVRSSGKKKRFCLEAMKMKKMGCKKMKGSNGGTGCELVSPSPFMGGCAPFASKGWNKVLKAASKHFKKKKRDPSSHVKLSNYLRTSGTSVSQLT